MKKGKVYLVGAGPGDPDLITQKGVNCLNKADVVIYDALVGEFERSVHILLKHPGVGTAWHRSKRRFRMKRFPYSLIYTVSGEEIRILAVAHHARRPGYWRRRK